MRPRKPGRKPTWGTNLQMFACIWIYPAFQAFAAGFIFYGVVLLGLGLVMGVVGRRLYREGMAAEPGAQIRTYDHREKRPTQPTSQDGVMHRQMASDRVSAPRFTYGRLSVVRPTGGVR